MIIKIHEETINIWTHLLSTIYFLNLLIRNFNLDIFSLYIFICILTYGISTIYHSTLLLGYTEIYNTILKLDLFMIICLIIISNNIIVYHYYWCYYDLLYNFNIFSISYNVIGLYILKNIDIIKYYNYYMGYIFIQNISLVYVKYDIYNRGDISSQLYQYNIPFYYYFIGFIIYMLKIPEIFSKNKFRLVGNSHQLWHIFSFMGSYSLYWDLIEYNIYRNSNYCI